MDKTLAIATILDAAPHTPTVFATGYAARIGASLDDHPRNFYMTGSMGLALPIGVGIALRSGMLTIVIDGDGAVLMNPAGLLTAACHPGLPLLHVVLDDGRYASTGGQSSGSDLIDLEALARSSGFTETSTVYETAALRSRLLGRLQAPAGLAFIRCRLSGVEPPPPSRVQAQLPSHARRFAGHLRTLREEGAEVGGRVPGADLISASPLHGQGCTTG
jgi:thiamine pyrophosphate-dependent acetolactate synthase large subunit-like protein